MSKMTCMEAVFDVLAGQYTAGLEHECFDDLVKGCYALASGESSEPDVVAWIAAHDKERSEVEIRIDVCDFVRRHLGKVKPSEVIARAIQAGKDAL